MCEIVSRHIMRVTTPVLFYKLFTKHIRVKTRQLTYKYAQPSNKIVTKI